MKVEFQEGHTNKIDLTDDIGITMAYPTFEYLNFKPDQTEVTQLFDIIGACIEQVYEGGNSIREGRLLRKDLKTFFGEFNNRTVFEGSEFL